MSIFFEAKDAQYSNLLHQLYGEEVILSEEGKDTTVYQVLKEFRLGNQVYAVLHSSELPNNVDYVLFRVVGLDLNDINLETIDDDEEWEAVAEVYDEMTFSM